MKGNKSLKCKLFWDFQFILYTRIKKNIGKHSVRVLAPHISRSLFLEAAFMINWAFFGQKKVKAEDKSISNGISLSNVSR